MRTTLALAVSLILFGFAGGAEPEEVDIRVSRNRIDFLVGTDLVTRYHQGKDVAKPYFWPISGPKSVPMTRSWPIDPEAQGESKDHVHHKSAWFCHGDVIPEGLELKDKVRGVAGVDFWSEARGHGIIASIKTSEPKLEKNHGQVTTTNEWRTADGTKIMDETRTIHLYNFGSTKLLVLEIDLVARGQAVTFGDTKEGSFGIRINDIIRESKGKGKIENADGKVGERACWGQLSAWCDYSGPIDAQTVGLAILDHPDNPYPACWHSRGYGLMAANPFGRAKSGFPAMKRKTDLVRVAKDEHLKLRYGLLIHPGDAKEGKVAEYFKQFVKLTSNTKNKRALLSPETQGQRLLLWPDGAPGAVGTTDKDKPLLAIYLPGEKATGAGVVVCPGGGYAGLADDHEGKQIAAWLTARGVAAFVLRYRHAPNYRHPIPLLDAQRALRLVRTKAEEWKVDPKRIGIWGFSAGGHLASTAATHFDEGIPDKVDLIERASCRPDFLILCYPVITMHSPYAHMGSRNNLLGKDADPKLVDLLSNEKQVTSKTPPTFLMHTNADNGVLPENSILFYLALRKARVPAELHIYEKGNHGVGLAPKDPVLSTWPERLEQWLQGRGVMERR